MSTNGCDLMGFEASCPNNKDAVHVGIDVSIRKYEEITR
jgi:hypothetical protein